MKRMNVMMAALMFAAVGIAKDIKTVVFNTAPEMHCSSCENRIKNGLKFEKGVKDIQTNLDNKTVTIEYDADKTNPEALVAAFAKIDYTATEATAEKKGGCCCSGKKTEAAEAKAGGCCGAKKAGAEATAEKKGGCCCSGKKAEAAQATTEKKGGCCCSGKKAAEATAQK